MTHTTRSRRTRFAALAVACSLSFGLAACSGGAAADTVAETKTGSGAVYGSCMRDAGFDVEDPDDASLESGVVRAPEGADREAFEKAMDACGKQAGVEGSSVAEQQKWARDATKVASCIRENGYPDFPEQKPGMIDAMGYERSGEAGFEKAARACSEKYSSGSPAQEFVR